MKQFVIILALVALTMGAPAPEESKRSLPAVELKDERDDSGYKVRYVTAEGTIVSENGHLVPTADGKDKVLETDGEVTYTGPDGKSYVTKWKAGVDGMKVEGEHLPVAPAVPEVPIVPDVPTVPMVKAVKIVEPSPPMVDVVPGFVGAPFIVQPPVLPVLPHSDVVVLSY